MPSAKKFGTPVKRILSAAVLWLSMPSMAALNIELSHQLDEVQAERIEPWIAQFNAQQKDVQVTLVRRVEGQPPKPLNIVTGEEYTRYAAKKAKFRPIHEVLREARIAFDASKLSPELRGGMLDGRGRLVALPLAFATPVLYINKAAFRKAGLNPDAPPKTWHETQEAAGKLQDSGSHCPFTSSWPAWVMIDNQSAWNGAEVSDAKKRFNFNGLTQIKYVAMMASWYKSQYFAYFGRRDEADRRFANGECGMLTSSSSLYPLFVASSSLEVGVSALPYYDDVYGAPKNTLADGASLWVADGLKADEKKGVAKFVAYILSPEVQVELTQAGGFLPMTPAARAAAGSKLLKADSAALQVAINELQGKAATSALRVSQVEPVRIIVEEELEAVWADKKPAKQALDDAVQRGNLVMRPAAPAARKGKRSK